MGLLISRLWSRLFGLQSFKCCLVGLDNAGKTTCLFHLHLGEVVETTPTIGSNVEEVIHKNVRMTVWDLGGQESLRPSWSTYFEQADAIILMVDSSDRKRLPILKEELNRIVTAKELEGCAMLVFANKQDLAQKMEPAEIAQVLELHKITEHPWHIQGCSALQGSGLYEGIDWLTQQVSSR